MTSTLDGLDARAKAAEIIRWRRLQQLEDAGLTVIERRRLEALERVAEIARHLYSHHYVEYNDETTWQELWDALEAMERETPAG